VAPPLLGYKKPPIETIHPVEFYYELVSTGKIKIDKNKKIKGPITIQDPCNLVRLRGGGEKIRYLVNATCEGPIIEMHNNRGHNYCCNGGGGGNAIGPPWKANRCDGARIKAEQIIATGCHTICAPCHNCYTSINDVLKYYKLEGHAKFMDELISETMVIPEEFKIEEPKAGE
jgi:Fe-S oxidoreductase